MIGRSYPEYIFIRICIFGLRLIAPLSIAYVVASWYSGNWLFHTYLGYYALLEAAFYLCVYLPRSWHLQKVSIFVDMDIDSEKWDRVRAGVELCFPMHLYAMGPWACGHESA